MSIHLVLNQKTFHNMQKNHGIKGNLNQWGRNVTKKEDKKCIIL